MTTFGSVCSGIEAASVAWGPLGWRAAWLSEIEPAPCSLLAHHYPDVPNLGDMTLIPQMLRNGDIPAPDVFCGGTPCQAFSVAGLRNSLDDARGNLSLIFCNIADEIDIQRRANGLLPCIAVWENVPGVLSTKDNAFGCFLGQLAGEDCALVAPGGKWPNAGVVLGPKRAIAWRVLDAQYFGVAQRRRRVLVVASAREGFDPAAVLFEFDGMRRDSAPSRSAREETAGTLASRTGAGGFPGTDEACSGYLQPVTGTLSVGGKASGSATQQDAHAGLLVPVNLKAEGFDASEGGTGRGQPITIAMRESGPGYWMEDEIAGTLRAEGENRPSRPSNVIAQAFQQSQSGVRLGDTVGTLRSSTAGGLHDHGVLAGMAVRRLTPRECERLQGFLDDYTLIPNRGKPMADGPRYKALGNSWAVPKFAWLGERIDAALRGAA